MIVPLETVAPDGPLTWSTIAWLEFGRLWWGPKGGSLGGRAAQPLPSAQVQVSTGWTLAAVAPQQYVYLLYLVHVRL